MSVIIVQVVIFNSGGSGRDHKHLTLRTYYESLLGTKNLWNDADQTTWALLAHIIRLTIMRCSMEQLFLSFISSFCTNQRGNVYY